MFRGNLLKIEQIALIGHGEADDDATLMISFEQDEINAKKRTIGQCLKAKDLLDKMQIFFDEQLPYSQAHCDKLKIVCVYQSNNVQDVFQLLHPKISGNQLVFNIEKCSDWRFKDIANDPATITVKQLKTSLKSASAKDGYVFMKGKNQTYGVVGIDMIDSDAFSYDGPHEMLALKISPWENLYEERQMKKKYTKKQITEAIAYWKKQLKAGNYKKLDEASYEEGQLYRRSLEKQARYVVPAVQRAVKQNELPGTMKPVQGDWIDLLDAACAIAYYAQRNCPDQDLVEMAEKIVQIGAGYMI